MGITTAWAISAHNDAFIEGLAPRMVPLIEADRDDPVMRERWQRWQRGPLPDYRTWGEFSVGTPEWEAIGSFEELTAAGRHVQQMYNGTDDDGFWLVRDVWEVSEGEQMFLSVRSKTYALAAFFHAVGPERAVLLPGWCGNFLLTSAEVRDSLPRVERALAFTEDERAAAERQIWLDERPEDESVIDGPLRQWRQASELGLGLCGVSLTIY